MKILLKFISVSVGILRSIVSGRFQTFIVLLAGSAFTVAAQSITASAQLSSQPGIGGLFNYTITLDNSAASTSPIGTFWYAWTPGQDYLPSSPSTPLTAPNGWTATLTHIGAGDGYAIEFVASSSANYITPGSFLDFNFETLDSPSALAGNSPYYPGTKVGTSTVYGAGPFSGPSDVFVVQSVPEPANLSLLALGSVGFVAARARRYWARVAT